MSPASYYFWKWADNDLPGKPVEVWSALLRGEMHPALQTFDPRPIVGQLEKAAQKGHMDGEEWDWEINPSANPQTAHFVFVTCPPFDGNLAMVQYFFDTIFPLDVSGYDEKKGIIIQTLLPKLNEWKTGQAPYERTYDIAPDDLPVLLRGLNSRLPDAFGVLTRRNNHFVQCYAHGRRFCVEWRENYDLKDWRKFDQWRAQDVSRLAALEEPYHTELPEKNDPDLLPYADTLRIFQAFLRGESRPAKYHWCNINDILKPT